MRRLSGLAWPPLLWALVSLACSLVSPSPQQPTPNVVIPSQPPSTPVPFTPVTTLQGKIAYASERDGVWQIIAMNADGSDETSLTEAFGTYSRPAWSPGGDKIGMRIDTATGSGIAVMDVRHESGRLAGSQPIAIVNAFADGPRWSPDGKKLVYSVAEGNSGWRTYIADLGSGTAQHITGIPENAVDPDWSPDGTRIVFSNYTDQRQIRDLYAINVDGTGLVQLTDTSEINESMPAWSPDGRRIAFAAVENQADGSPRQDIFLMDSDGSNLIQLTTDPGGDFDPSWSPDGKQLAFVSERDANNDSNYEIYLINVDGTGEMRLTNNRYTDRWPTWRAEQAEDAQPAACQPGMSMVENVTIPPGTRFAIPQPFTKVWRVQNTGTCTWTPSSYSLRFVEGEQMGAGVDVMIPGAIQPGATVDLVLPLTAPRASGSHTGKWEVFDGQGSPLLGADGQSEALEVAIEVLPEGESLLPQPLYFLSERGGNSQLWRLEANARTLTQVTNGPQPVISFDVAENGRIAFVSQNQVILTDRDGGDRMVIAALAEGGFGFNVAWSPGGDRLAYRSGGIRVYDMQTARDTLLIADSESRTPGMFLYEPFGWSPDGSKLLVRVYLWESGAFRVISSSDGTVLAEFPLEDSAWSTDSQAVYYASASSTGMMPGDPGLWRAPLTGEKPQPLISKANVWWPAQSPDGSLLFFMHPPAFASEPDYLVLPYRSDPSAGDRILLHSQPLILSPNDTFNVRWTKDARQYVAQIVRPALDVSEVLLYSPDGTLPLFLMQEIGSFDWGT